MFFSITPLLLTSLFFAKLKIYSHIKVDLEFAP